MRAHGDACFEAIVLWVSINVSKFIVPHEFCLWKRGEGALSALNRLLQISFVSLCLVPGHVLLGICQEVAVSSLQVMNGRVVGHAPDLRFSHLPSPVVVVFLLFYYEYFYCFILIVVIITIDVVIIIIVIATVILP